MSLCFVSDVPREVLGFRFLNNFLFSFFGHRDAFLDTNEDFVRSRKGKERKRLRGNGND